MAGDQTQTSRGDSDQAEPSKPVAQSGQAAVAKRVASWTTNGLLTAIVIVAALGFGRQVLVWWSSGTSGNGSTVGPIQANEGLGDPAQVHILQFGDHSWSIRRQAIVGDKTKAARMLVAMCRDAMAKATPPEGRPSETELRFLAGLDGRKPVEELVGQWQLYQWTEGFPIVAGIRIQRPPERSKAGSQLAEPGCRVVTWGLAMPMGPDSWTLLTFQPDVGSNVSSEGFPEIPLPPGCRKVASVRVAGGGAVMAFTGPELPETGMRFYDRWFAQQGWKASDAWQAGGTAWHVRFVSARPAGLAADVRLGVDQRGQLAGVVVVGAE